MPYSLCPGSSVRRGGTGSSHPCSRTGRCCSHSAHSCSAAALLAQALVIALLELVLRERASGMLEDLRIAFSAMSSLERKVLPVQLHVRFLLADALLLLLRRNALRPSSVVLLIRSCRPCLAGAAAAAGSAWTRIIGPTRPREVRKKQVRSGPAREPSNSRLGGACWLSWSLSRIRELFAQYRRGDGTGNSGQALDWSVGGVRRNHATVDTASGFVS